MVRLIVRCVLWSEKYGNLNSFETSETTHPTNHTASHPKRTEFFWMWIPWEEEAWWDCCVKSVIPSHPHCPFNRSCVFIRLFHLMKQRFWSEVCYMYSYLNAYSKDSGIITDMSGVIPTCYNFCPCGNSTWCGLHGVDLAVRKST